MAPHATARMSPEGLGLGEKPVPQDKPAWCHVHAALRVPRSVRCVERRWPGAAGRWERGAQEGGASVLKTRSFLRTGLTRTCRYREMMVLRYAYLTAMRSKSNM